MTSFSELETSTASQALVVLCTVPSTQVGEQMARTLLEEHLVACVNIIPGIRSLYRWQGDLHDDQELILLIKTPRSRYTELERRLQQLHPYEVCEVLALDVAAAAPAYLQWLIAESKPQPA